MSKTFKRIASIALPIAASFIPGIGPLGAAALGGLGGAIGGGGVKGALLGALGSGLGAGVLGGAPGASGIGMIDKLNTGLYSAMSPLRSIASSVGNSISSGFNDLFGTAGNAAGSAASGATSATAPIVGVTSSPLSAASNMTAADQAFLNNAASSVAKGATYASPAAEASKGILGTITDKIMSPSLGDIIGLANVASVIGQKDPAGTMSQEQVFAQMQADKAAEDAKTKQFIAGLTAEPLQRNQTNPQIDYYNYGSRPEVAFFDQIGTSPVAKLAKGGKVPSPLSGIGGQDDTVDAKLSVGEYVIPSDIVASLGDGNNDAGAKALDELLKNVRKHKAPAMKKGTLPPKAKSPLAYLGKAA